MLRLLLERVWANGQIVWYWKFVREKKAMEDMAKRTYIRYTFMRDDENISTIDSLRVHARIKAVLCKNGWADIRYKDNIL